MSKQSDPSVDRDIASRVQDDIGDSFPRDWLEALIVFLAGLGVFGSAYALFVLYEAAQGI
jgi:hypothetical protein